MVGRTAINIDVINIGIEQARLYPPTVSGTSSGILAARQSIQRVLQIARTPIGIRPAGLELGFDAGVSAVLVTPGDV